MTKFVWARYLAFVLLAALVVTSTACNSKTVAIATATVTNPGSTGGNNQDVQVLLSAPETEVSLNSCPATVVLEAKAIPSSAVQTFVWNEAAVRQMAGVVSFTISGTSATLRVNQPGDYLVVANWGQDSSKTDFHVVKARGNGCGSTGPGPGTPNPGGDVRTITLDPSSGTGEVGTTMNVRAVCRLNGVEVACAPRWTSTITDRVQIIGSGTGSSTTIKFISAYESQVCADWEAYGIRACGPFRGTSSNTQANLSVNPTTLIFQLGGNGCSATGPLTFVATSNQTITLSGWNSSIVSVSTSSPSSGSPVTVTPHAVGSTTITVTSGGETRTVSITVNPCVASDACAGANAVLPALDTKGQSKPFVINAGGSCRWALRSSNAHVVSATPFEGIGPSPTTATLWALNSGGPVTITLVLNQGASNERLIDSGTYTIK